MSPGSAAPMSDAGSATRGRHWNLTRPIFAAATAAGVALLSAIASPRGPATTAEALMFMVSGFLLGAVAGFVWPRRRAILVAAVAYMVVYELARPGSAGPSVGAIRFDSTIAIMLLVLGRGLHGLLVFLPMLFGGTVARRVAIARTPRTQLLRQDQRGRMRGRLWTGIGALATGGLAVLVAWPASTPPVLGADGRPIAGSIAELTTIRIGGEDQAVMIRAADPTRPVLLYLSGGPGQSDLAYSRVFTEGWVHDFVFVDWDQRGTGKSYGALAPLATMTLDQAVSDTIELSDYLRQRFSERRIYLMGESWGTILGVLAVQRRPDLYYAWIGSGQMVNVLETDRRIYDDLMAYAAQSGDAGLATELMEIGRPPYRDFPYANAKISSYYDYIYKPYTPSQAYRDRGAASGIGLYGVLGSEYTLVEKTNVLRGLADTFAVMYPQLYGIDLRRDVPRLDVPVYILDGAAELEGRRALAVEWFDELQAPSKQRLTYQDAAHSVAFEQADAVQALLVQTIVPATYGR